jgi:two-component sensor histidine kinase
VLAAAPERLALVFSELATNALRHGSPPVSVTLSRGRRSWLLVVADGLGGSGPRPRAPAPGVGGHGLHLVLALTHATGWVASGLGKEVWAELDDAPPRHLLDALRLP